MIRLGLVSLAFLLTTAATPRDACQLLTKKDVAAVQGQAFSSAKLTTRGTRSQCFYEMASFVDSISVDVIRGDGREFWRENFAPKASEEAGKKKKQPPKRIEGIGDGAYWVGSRTAGSLYVLQKESVLRVSIGGKATEAEKIARTKRLAAKALRRL
jgi:hypothetical protein